MHNSDRVHFSDSAEKRPSRLHTRLMRFNSNQVSSYLQPDINKFPSAQNRMHGFRKFNSLQWCPNLAHDNLAINEGIDLLPGRPDHTRNPGLQDISTMAKQDQQSRPMRRQIPIGAAHISFSGQHRMRLATSKTNPQVSPRWPRRLLGSDQHLDKHWPGGVK